MNSLMRLLRSDKVPLFKGLTVLPLSLNPEPDQTLTTMTEGRLGCFNHEVVPDYLRTKPVPEVEAKHVAVEMRANQVNQELINVQETLQFICIYAVLYEVMETTQLILTKFTETIPAIDEDGKSSN